jgi:hypothetical protein
MSGGKWLEVVVQLQRVGQPPEAVEELGKTVFFPGSERSSPEATLRQIGGKAGRQRGVLLRLAEPLFELVRTNP